MQYSAYTNVGRIRNQNEDCYMAEELSDSVCLFTVCDGMGGASAGETASATACSVYHSALTAALQPHLTSAHLLTPLSAKLCKRLMLDALNEANAAVYQLSKTDPALEGMGTTLVSILLVNKTAYIVNVGDSRAYYYKDGQLCQITKDHSYVQYLIDNGLIQPDEAESHPHKNLITRSVGTSAEITPDLFALDTRRTDLILLCSDGLTNMVNEAEIADVLGNDEVEFPHKAERLVAKANSHGGTDNITALVVSSRLK
ncbi:MAG: Stp1/IreP family PP2C-type Ser/Thr phosphatase [Eubacteriales bacterium]